MLKLLSRILGLTALVLLASGCFGMTGLGNERLQRFASGAVPCSPGDINVESASTDDGWPATWIAFCSGEKYYCSVAAVGAASCSKEPQAPPTKK